MRFPSSFFSDVGAFFFLDEVYQIGKQLLLFPVSLLPRLDTAQLFYTHTGKLAYQRMKKEELQSLSSTSPRWPIQHSSDGKKKERGSLMLKCDIV